MQLSALVGRSLHTSLVLRPGKTGDPLDILGRLVINDPVPILKWQADTLLEWTSRCPKSTSWLLDCCAGGVAR